MSMRELSTIRFFCDGCYACVEIQTTDDVPPSPDGWTNRVTLVPNCEPTDYAGPAKIEIRKDYCPKCRAKAKT